MARADRRSGQVAAARARAGRTGQAPALEKPVKSAVACMRHDARSAAHALSGFVDLLRMGALGALNEGQLQALDHMQTAAERLCEISDAALELAEATRPLKRSEEERPCLAQVTQSVLYALSQSLPDTRFSFRVADGIDQLPVEMETDTLRKLLEILLEVAQSTAPTQIELRLSRTDLHASLVLAARQEEASALRSVPPPHNAASSDLEALASGWGNREYVRLKRCEALLARQRGRLLVTGDLSRMRVMLPLDDH